MTFTDSTPVQGRTLTAFFDTQEAADRAVDDLVSAGIPREHIGLKSGGTKAGVATDHDEKGLWAELKDMFLPDEDSYSYAEGIRRGGYLLTVRTEDGNYNHVLDLLDREGSVDMDEREATWKQEGWQGYQTPARPVMPAVATAPRMVTETTEAPVTAVRSSVTNDVATAGGDQSISLYEEQMRVGKRDVSHGKVRLRSYVIETPVTERVDLRSESVHVDRKPVDRPIAATDAMFQDRVIEAEEFAEEAVVSKTAHVTEEVSLRKVATTDTQTVTDTLRHTELEVDDKRGGHGLMATTAASEIREHMDVIASDGEKVGTVDHMDGADRIKLAKSTSPDGEHHFIPLAWVDHVDQHVHLNRPKMQVVQGW